MPLALETQLKTLVRLSQFSVRRPWQSNRRTRTSRSWTQQTPTTTSTKIPSHGKQPPKAFKKRSASNVAKAPKMKRTSIKPTQCSTGLFPKLRAKKRCVKPNNKSMMISRTPCRQIVKWIANSIANVANAVDAVSMMICMRCFFIPASGFTIVLARPKIRVRRRIS